MPSFVHAPDGSSHIKVPKKTTDDELMGIISGFIYLGSPSWFGSRIPHGFLAITPNFACRFLSPRRAYDVPLDEGYSVCIPML